MMYVLPPFTTIVSVSSVSKDFRLVSSQSPFSSFSTEISSGFEKVTLSTSAMSSLMPRIASSSLSRMLSSPFMLKVKPS